MRVEPTCGADASHFTGDRIPATGALVTWSASLGACSVFPNQNEGFQPGAKHQIAHYYWKFKYKLVAFTAANNVW